MAQPPPTANHILHNTIIVLLCILFIPLLIWYLLNLNYQVKVNQLTSAINQIDHDFLKPMGGVSFDGIGGDCTKFNESLDFGAGPCPRLGTQWEVPVPITQEKTLLSTILKKEGYALSPSAPNNPTMYGVKDGYTVSLDLGFDEAFKPPYPAPAGKEWLYVNIGAY